jgi:hypothetical protein
MRKSVVGVGLGFAVAIGSPLLTAASADDQARLDAVIEAFNDRMTAAGWQSQGPPPDDGDADVADDESDEALQECFGALLALVPEGGDADEFPGETASRESDEFIYVPPTEGAVTTDAFSLDFDEEETVSAFAGSVDDANVSTLTQFVETFGSKETVDCIHRELEAQMEAESADADIPVEFEVDVTNQADLGIGDHSSSIRFSFSIVFMVPISVYAEIAVAQVGNDVVGVAHAVTGEPQSDFDPVAELQLLADSLSG